MKGFFLCHLVSVDLRRYDLSRFNSIAFQFFNFERTWWRLLQQKCVMRTKFDIHVFINIFCKIVQANVTRLIFRKMGYFDLSINRYCGKKGKIKYILLVKKPKKKCCSNTYAQSLWMICIFRFVEAKVRRFVDPNVKGPMFHTSSNFGEIRKKNNSKNK